MNFFVAAGEDLCLDTEARGSLRGSFVALSDGVTHYELRGASSNPAVVLAGGLTVPLFYWDSLATALHGLGFRTLTYSAYGRGYSDRIVSLYDEALFVRQLAELIDAVGLTESHHVVGASLGALVAMSYARIHAAKIRSLTLVGPSGLQRSPLSRWLQSDVLGSFVGKHFGRRMLERHTRQNVRDAEHATALREMIDNTYRYRGSLYALFSTLQNFPLTEREKLFEETSQLGLNSLLLWGTDDRVTPIDGLDAARALLRPTRSLVITNCGHMVPLERPMEMANHFVSFVANSK